MSDRFIFILFKQNNKNMLNLDPKSNVQTMDFVHCYTPTTSLYSGNGEKQQILPFDHF